MVRVDLKTRNQLNSTRLPLTSDLKMSGALGIFLAFKGTRTLAIHVTC